MLEAAKHFFLPRFSNDQKARLLHAEIILVIALLITILQGAIYFGSRSQIAILGYAANISIEEVVNLTNNKRSENGLSTLTINQDLNAAAYLKGLDMLEKNYWAHVSPDGTEPWAFFADIGYDYRYAGENLARDFSNANSAIDAWMASPSHRDNMLSEKYEEIGIAVVEGDMNGQDTTIIVQLFGTRSTPQLAAVPEAAAETEETEIEPEVASENIEVVSIPEAVAQEVTEIEQPIEAVSPKVSPFVTTQTISLIVMGLLAIVLIIDIIEVERRKISRIGGRKLAHLAYLFTIIAILVISKAGEIL